MRNTQRSGDVAARNNGRQTSQGGSSASSLRMRRLIQSALLALSRERDFDTISVSEVCHEATINRSTFYRQYENKYMVADAICSEAMGRPFVDLERLGPHVSAKDRAALFNDKRRLDAWTSLFEHFHANSRLYLGVFGGKGSSWFQARMRQHIVDLMRQVFPVDRRRKRPQSVPPEVARWMASSAIAGLIQLWLESGKNYTASEVALWFAEVVESGYIKALVGWDS
jgi:AcrR family transcriptional regulator